MEFGEKRGTKIYICQEACSKHRPENNIKNLDVSKAMQWTFFFLTVMVSLPETHEINTDIDKIL